LRMGIPPRAHLSNVRARTEVSGITRPRPDSWHAVAQRCVVETTGGWGRATTGIAVIAIGHSPGTYCHVHFNSPWQLVARCERSCDPNPGSDVCGKDAFCGETDFMNALPGVKDRC